MIIGTLRPEEAKVFNGSEGYHRIGSASIEVFWHEDYEIERPGWYWWACFPGCLPDGDPAGPFGSSHAALADAEEFE